MRLCARVLPSLAVLFSLLACPSQKDVTGLSDRKPIKVEQGSSPFVEVASRLIPSVVNISVQHSLPSLPQLHIRNPLDRLFRRPVQPETPEFRTDALGSGVIFDERGYILTNYHVVRGYERLKVILSDNTSFSGDQVKVIGGDEKSDLAVVKVNTRTRLAAAVLGNSDSLRVGDWAIAVGNPFALSGSVTVGVISAIGRGGLAFPQAPSYQDFIQTDVAINPGNSGGPLVNIRGEVIGINTLIQSQIGANIGIGFAIPVNTARAVSEQLMAGGKVVRGYLGVSIQEITPDLKDALGLPGTEGVVVTEVVTGSPAEKAGIKSDDVITKYNGTAVGELEHFRLAIAELPPGTDLALTILRGGQEISVNVKLTTMPEQPVATARPTTPETTNWLGLTVAPLGKTEQQSSGVKQGVSVAAVDLASPAGVAGVLTGDIITTVNQRTVADIRSFAAIARSLARSNRPVTFGIVRGKTRYSITVTP